MKRLTQGWRGPGSSRLALAAASVVVNGTIFRYNAVSGAGARRRRRLLQPMRPSVTGSRPRASPTHSRPTHDSTPFLPPPQTRSRPSRPSPAALRPRPPTPAVRPCPARRRHVYFAVWCCCAAVWFEQAMLSVNGGDTEGLHLCSRPLCVGVQSLLPPSLHFWSLRTQTESSCRTLCHTLRYTLS